MRVAVVSAWEPWRLTDGAVWVLHHHLHHLAARHDVTVLAAGAPDDECPSPPEARTVPDGVGVRWFGSARPAAVDYAHRWVASRRTGEPVHVPYDERRRLLEALRKEVATRRPDVLHAFGWGTAGMWQYVDGVPVVHVAVDAWQLNAGNRRMPGWRRWVGVGETGRIARHEQRHYPHDAAVVVVAESDADELRSAVPRARIEVVPNGVEAGPEPVPPPTAPVLGFHGSFESQHNVDAAVALVREVLPRVRAVVPDARVLLVGRSPGSEVRELVGEGVELHSDVPDVRAELDNVAVYVAPLVSGSGLKNKVLEAMAAGRPVVTTALGSGGIGAGPGLVEADGPESIAAAAVALLRDRGGLVDAGAAGRSRVLTDFTWERSAAAIEAIWRDVSGEEA